MKFGNIIKRQKREENKEELNQEMWVRLYIEYKIGASIIDSIPHCNTENNLKRGKKTRNVASLLYREQNYSIYYR